MIKLYALTYSTDKPEAPLNFSVETTTFRSANLSWIVGFNGGHEQTFTVQFKTTDGDGATNSVQTSDAKTGSKVYYILDQLKPDTLYHVMVLSTNTYGYRNASLEFKTEEPTESNVLYAAVDKVQQKFKRRNTEDEIETANDEYAVVDKSNRKINFTDDDTTYANQGDADLLIRQPSKKSHLDGKNKDGLTYIEVSFTRKPKNKRVIIGAENRTNYVDIDFTRTADPLPETADE
ncbi:unnamed protein product [Mytilus edulis]|uniref:Fibronectin type-III domain-containing protein n=1 Tax=Mytilus edulis TaxID=6550 RepID=A0A8S3TFA9_MYTED|nr:unnamed protein product [Mytilus edulis]